MNLGRYKQTLKRKATTRSILVLSGLVILFMGALFPSLTERLRVLSGGGVLLDTQFYYPPERAVEMISTYGDEGRTFYLWILLSADLLFPLVYGTLLVMLLAKAAVRLSSRFDWLEHLLWLPVFPVLLDYGENAAIGFLLWGYPNVSNLLATQASFFTVVKWSSLLAICLLIAASWLAILMDSFHQKRR